MTKVTIVKLFDDGSQKPLAVCHLGADGSVVCEGDMDIVTNLNTRGITDIAHEGTKLFPKDGAAFLAQLKNNFASGYLSTVEEN